MLPPFATSIRQSGVFVPAGLALLALAAQPLRALDELVSPAAITEARSLQGYLSSIQGKAILSGQQEIAWDNNRVEEDINYIFQKTGKLPVVRGFDFLQYVKSPATRANETASERAINWARKGGIVTFCCHFFVNIGSNNGSPQFYTPGTNGKPEGTTFDIRQALIDGTPENTEFLAKLDLIAGELKKLRDARVPVIWRPFHECGGTWFWWSAKGPAPFIQAYRLMFTRFTQMHGLTNLIWVFNPTDSASTMTNWYPGDDVVDMIALDTYPNGSVHPSFAVDSQRMNNFRSSRKLVAMSENGNLPDPEELFAQGGLWSYFCTWNGYENDLGRNSVAFLSMVFNHPKVITLDEVPGVYVGTPRILVQPGAITTRQGARVVLSVIPANATNLTLQWKKNGIDLPGATATACTIASAGTGDAGSYTVTLANALGSVTSNTAIVTIDPAPYTPPPATLINISTRGQVGTSDNVMIAGFVIGGSGSKTLLIRAVGPTLAGFNVGGTLADPSLTLFQDQTVIATNDNWNDDPALAAAATNCGAFALNAGSADAALIVTLPGGAYTARISGLGNSTGVALLEVYDVDPASAARLLNLSTRGFIGIGDAQLIAGFSVAGSAPLRLLIRASGPALAAFGVPGALPDPQINLTTQSGTRLASNNNWDSDNRNAIVAAETAAGAFHFTSGLKDAALISSLAGGQYTPMVFDAGGATGVGLVEIFDLP